MKRIFQRRYPSYLGGFLLGLTAVVIILQAKKAFAPDFKDMPDKRLPITLVAGGNLRLKLGDEPGKYLAWGFPTQLEVGKVNPAGGLDRVIRMEYKNLVEKETLVGPFEDAGEYELVAHFYTCAFPGEKSCARIMLEQKVLVSAKREGAAPPEVDLAVDIKSAAEKTSSEKAPAEKSTTQARPIP